MQTKNLSIIIPALNEEDAIKKTITQIKTTLLPLVQNLEIIVVNDGSTDQTGIIAEQANAKVIHHPEPGGYGLSLKDGIQSAQYELIAITDADGTYPIDHLPKLLEYIPAYDMVVGQRTGKEYRGTFLKYPARKLFLWLAEFAAGQTIPDINSGLRVFKKEKALPYFDTLCRGFSFTTTITLAFLLNGHFVKYVPIPYYKRIGQSKIRYFRDTLRTTQIITEAILYYNPIKLFILLSASSLILGAVALIIAILKDPNFYLLTGVSILIALLIFGIGLIADLIRKNGQRS